MRYQFLIDSYATEIEKVLGTWAMFRDEDMPARPHPTDPRGRNLLEHMVHQSVSENLWFASMLGIAVTDRPLLEVENRLALSASTPGTPQNPWPPCASATRRGGKRSGTSSRSSAAGPGS